MGTFQHDIRNQRIRIKLSINFEQDLFINTQFMLLVRIFRKSFSTSILIVFIGSLICSSLAYFWIVKLSKFCVHSPHQFDLFVEDIS